MIPTRVIWVGLGIVGAGVVMGALAAMIVAVSIALTFAFGPDPVLLLGEPLLYGVSALIGGVCGAVLAPIAAFGYLRHVPLWRVFAEGTLGTVVAGVLGALAFEHVGAVLAAGALGFILATGRLAAMVPEPAISPGRSPAG